MNWSSYNALVRTHLTAYNRVKGIQDWLDLLIKAGTTDVQRAVPYYQQGNTYSPTLVDDGYAQTAATPAGVITGAYIVKGEEHNPVEQVPFSRALIEGTRPDTPVYALDATGRKFWVYPAVPDDATLVLEWTGVKTDYADNDVVPFDEPFAHAVSEYVMARVARQVDHDMGAAQSYAASFTLLKRQLFSERRGARIFAS